MTDIDPRDCQHGWADTEQTEIESLRQQLAEVINECGEYAYAIKVKENQLAECQAREKVLREVLKLSWSEEYVNGIETGKKAEEAIAMPFDSTALDEAIKQAKREALLEASEHFFDSGGHSVSVFVARELRRMAGELK